MQQAPYRRVPISRKDGFTKAFALVDLIDFAECSKHRWNLNRGYPVRWVYQPDGSQHAIYMHREILGLVRGDGRQADHVNRNPLDNRRANLRVVTHAENMRNRRSTRGSTSKYRGVYWETKKKKWRAACRAYGKKFNLGHFTDEDEAGRAAAEFRRQLGWPE